VAGETAVFLQGAVHKVQDLGELGWTALNSLLEEISETFHPNLAINGFGQVQVPDLERDRISEQIQTALIDFKAVLKVLVLLE
jgi:hypothetical protein